MKRNKLILLGALSLFMVLPLASCSCDEPTPTPEPEPKPYSVSFGNFLLVVVCNSHQNIWGTGHHPRSLCIV